MRNEQIKEKIIKFYKKNKRMPSYSETAILFNYASKNSAYNLMSKMIEMGFIKKDITGKIIPSSSFGELKVLGLVEAGFPSASEEVLIDSLSLDDFLIDNKEATYFLRVKGDSMIEAGIYDGDMVIVERNENPKVGDIVIAEVDGEWTIKFFKKRDGKPYLLPANKNYKPIYPKEELKITAVVKAVIRKY